MFSSLEMSVRECGRNRRRRGERGAPAGMGKGPADPTTWPLALPFDECGHMYVRNMLVNVLDFS